MEQTTKEAIAQRNGGKRLSGGAGKKPLIIIGILVAVLAAAYLGLCAYAASLDVFFPNTTINGVDVAGMTVQQAGEELGSNLPQRTMAFYLPLTDKSGDGVTAPEGETLYDPEPAATVSCESLGITQDLDYTAYAQSVYDRSQGQSGFFQGGWSFLAHLFHSQGAKGVYLEPDGTVFRQKLSELAQTFSRPAQDASYEVGQDSLTVTRELDGLAVTEADLEQPIRDALSSEADGAVYVDAAILPAQALSAQDIHDAVAGSMKNAGYDAATGSITPEQAGAGFDVAEAQALLDAASPGETVEIPADIQQPHVTAAELKEVLFRDVLGQCRTHVSGTSARINNVKLSAAACNGVVLNTGDVFSYNATTGQRTPAKGYQAAPAYVGGETVDEVGGGVCQTSSTIYYACLRANLEITERYAHRYVPAYIDWGMDATVSWGGPDYKFTNNTDYPIKIVATYSGGYLTVKILGTNVDGTYAKMTNEVLSKTNWETVYKDDETLPAGTEKVTTTPYTGYKVKSYRNVYSADGKLISSTYEATSDYKVRNKVISRGPALPEQPETPVTGPAETPVEPPIQTPEETTPSTTTPDTSTLDPSQEQTQTPAQETPAEP